MRFRKSPMGKLQSCHERDELRLPLELDLEAERPLDERPPDERRSRLEDDPCRFDDDRLRVLAEEPLRPLDELLRLRPDWLERARPPEGERLRPLDDGLLRLRPERREAFPASCSCGEWECSVS